jgi:hypothetical protein
MQFLSPIQCVLLKLQWIQAYSTYSKYAQCCPLMMMLDIDHLVTNQDLKHLHCGLLRLKHISSVQHWSYHHHQI